MSYTIKNIQDELESDGRFTTELTDEEILRIQSDDWADLVSGKPDEVQAYKTDENKFDVRTVGGSGERFEMSFKRAIHYISSTLTE